MINFLFSFLIFLFIVLQGSTEQSFIELNGMKNLEISIDSQLEKIYWPFIKQRSKEWKHFYFFSVELIVYLAWIVYSKIVYLWVSFLNI